MHLQFCRIYNNKIVSKWRESLKEFLLRCKMRVYLEVDGSQKLFQMNFKNVNDRRNYYYSRVQLFVRQGAVLVFQNGNIFHFISSNISALSFSDAESSIEFHHIGRACDLAQTHQLSGLNYAIPISQTIVVYTDTHFPSRFSQLQTLTNIAFTLKRSDV